MSAAAAASIAIEAIQKNYGKGDIREVKIFHNAADFTDEEDVPGGLLMIHPLEAKVHVDSIPLNAFSYLAIVPVLPRKDGSNDWSAHLGDSSAMAAAVNAHVPQFAATSPPSLKTRDINTPLDGKTWNVEFGEDESAFAGVFKQIKGRETYYYIAVQAGAPTACKQLREKISRLNSACGVQSGATGSAVGGQPQSPGGGLGLTFSQLLEDPDYNYAHYIAQRNVERIAYNVARALKLPIKHQPDTGSKKDFPHSGLPMKASPAYMQQVSTIMPIIHNSERVIGVFSKLTPVSNAAAINFVYEGPYNGIAVFHMNKQGVGHAIPAQSGKVDSAERAPLSQSEITKRSKGVICEGIGGSVRHPDVATDAYRATDTEEFRDSMKELGWKAQNLNNLIPVLIKIFDPSVKRK